MQPLVPELSVVDLERSLSFYCGLLGFEVLFDRPEDRFAYLSFHGSELMIEEDRPSEGVSSPWIIEPLDYPRGRGLNLSIACPDAVALVARLQEGNVSLQKPLEDKWYRVKEAFHGERNFLVQDPDGYLLRFAEDLGVKSSNATE
jgi:lactoylglutathione lyase